MTIEKIINVDGKEYPIVISDEPQTILTAKAAGRIVVGIGDDITTDTEGSGEADPADWLPADYVVESLSMDDAWLESVARRQLGIPWKITETARLIIREFSVDDCARIPDDADDSLDEAILKNPVRLQAYIDEQYAFFNCGMWAIVRKEDDRIVGMLSLIPIFSYDDVETMSDIEPVSDPKPVCGPDPEPVIDVVHLYPDIYDRENVQYGPICEFGYHIYTPYRRCGYAKEACESILRLLSQRKTSVVARVKPQNIASIKLLKDLGFEQRSADCFFHPYFV